MNRGPYSEWGPAIAAAVRLLAAPAWGRPVAVGSAGSACSRKASPRSRQAVDDPLLDPAEARLVVDDWSREVPSPLHFRTGDITVCTLVPMRSVPYRVVCLLGMDDQRFPRNSRADGDDLLVDNEIIGDSDRGAEDRQLLLDAVMAAGDYLIVTYSGRDELTNAEYPPAVPGRRVDRRPVRHGGGGRPGESPDPPSSPSRSARSTSCREVSVCPDRGGSIPCSSRVRGPSRIAPAPEASHGARCRFPRMTSSRRSGLLTWGAFWSIPPASSSAPGSDS